MAVCGSFKLFPNFAKGRWESPTPKIGPSSIKISNLNAAHLDRVKG